jgi:alpha-galactosidase
LLTRIGRSASRNRPREPCAVQAGGLDAEASYRHLDTGKVYGGNELMYVGLTLPITAGDFHSPLYRFRRVDAT